MKAQAARESLHKAKEVKGPEAKKALIPQEKRPSSTMHPPHAQDSRKSRITTAPVTTSASARSTATVLKTPCTSGM